MTLWTTVPLGELADLQAGAGFPPSMQGRLEGELPLAKVGDISRAVRAGGRGLIAPLHHITRAEAVQLRARIFPAGSIVFAKIGEAISQNYRLFTDREATFDNNVMGAIPRTGRIEPRYLFRFLQTLDLYAYSSKTTVPALRKSDLEQIPVPLPDAPEQRRIADILDKADAIRRKRKETIALTEELLRSAFLEIFGDPVTNPKGWPVRALGDVVTLFAGNSLPPGVDFSGQRDGYLLMKVGDMNIPGNEVEVSVTREWAATVPSAAVVAPAGAVVIPKRGGAIATNKKRVLTRPAALDPNLMAIAPGSLLQLEYLRQWFEGTDLAKLSNGSAVPQLNKKDLAPLTVPVPSPHRQVAFAEYAKRIRSMRTRAEHAHVEASILFSGLVARAFSGSLGAPC